MSRFYLSPDGGEDLIGEKETVLDEPCVCYHCFQKIYTGEVAAELTAWDGSVFVVHKKCAERSVRDIPKEG